jgi:regulator of sirC expression with transglutaminase-like and TPR domain
MFARIAVPKFDAADQKVDRQGCGKEGGKGGDRQGCGEEAGEGCDRQGCGEEADEETSRKENESEKEVSESPNRASALAELAALAENVERCRERIVALAESQRLATYDPKKPENNDDGLLMAIYEAERGLISAVRLLQRAARSR